MAYYIEFAYFIGFILIVDTIRDIVQGFNRNRYEDNWKWYIRWR